MMYDVASLCASQKERSLHL